MNAGISGCRHRGARRAPPFALGRARRPLVALLAPLLLIALPACADGRRAAAEDSSRLAAPDDYPCDRDALTSYTGRLQAIETVGGGTILVIVTDWDTVERVSVPGESTLSIPENAIEDGVRLTAWVCDDPATPPRIDWEPPRH